MVNVTIPIIIITQFEKVLRYPLDTKWFVMIGGHQLDKDKTRCRVQTMEKKKLLVVCRMGANNINKKKKKKQYLLTRRRVYWTSKINNKL